MKTRKHTKQLAYGVTKDVYIRDWSTPENISEYFYNKGFINGLMQGNKLDENKLSALVAVYETKTKHIDNLLEEER